MLRVPVILSNNERDNKHTKYPIERISYICHDVWIIFIYFIMEISMILLLLEE